VLSPHLGFYAASRSAPVHITGAALLETITRRLEVEPEEALPLLEQQVGQAIGSCEETHAKEAIPHR
jgi:hypothetical protein